MPPRTTVRPEYELAPVRNVEVLPARTKFRLPVIAPPKALSPKVVKLTSDPREFVRVPAWPGFSFELRSWSTICG